MAGKPPKQMAGKLPKCTPGKSYNCGKICLPIKRMCHINPQAKPEKAELATLGGLLGGTERKALPPARERKALPPAKERELDLELEDFLTRKEEEGEFDPEFLAELKDLEVLPDEPVTKKAKKQKAPSPAKKQEREPDPEPYAPTDPTHPKNNKEELSALRGFWNKAYQAKDRKTNPESLALQLLFKGVMRPKRTEKHFSSIRQLMGQARQYLINRLVGREDKNTAPVIVGLADILEKVYDYEDKLVLARRFGTLEKAYDPENVMLRALFYGARNGTYDKLLKEMINKVRSVNRKRGKGRS